MHTLINLTVPATLAGERLDLALVALLTEAAPQLAPSRRQVKKWLDEGKVQINHKTCRMASRALRAGERVAVAIPQAEPEVNLTPALLRPQDIIFEDEDLLVINKPAGLPSQGTRDPTLPHVVQAAQRWLEDQREPHPYIALHHRLDVETSGVIAMAKARRANAGLARSFRDRRAQKAYIALVSSQTSPWPHAEEAAWEVRDRLGEVQGGARRGSVLSGGDPAHSSFKWIARVPGLAFGYEEAIGYCVAPELVRDKDGISAAVVAAQLANRVINQRTKRLAPVPLTGMDRQEFLFQTLGDGGDTCRTRHLRTPRNTSCQPQHHLRFRPIGRAQRAIQTIDVVERLSGEVAIQAVGHR